MIEAEAKTKWCPFVRITWNDMHGELEFNRSERLPDATRCIGSACMAWRRGRALGENPDPSGNGFCGLAGKP